MTIESLRGQAPSTSARRLKAETKYENLEGKLDGIRQSMARLLKVIGQQSHQGKHIEGRLIRDPTKGKAPLEESIGSVVRILYV